MTWTRILVPHDFSVSANKALDVAIDEAKLHDALLVILHVIELAPALEPHLAVQLGTEGRSASVIDYATTNAATELEPLLRRVREQGVVVSAEVRFGRPPEEIVRFCDETRADLVVMGTHGRSGLAHMLAGSVAERVVRTSKVPVLTIRQTRPSSR